MKNTKWIGLMVSLVLCGWLFLSERPAAQSQSAQSDAADEFDRLRRGASSETSAAQAREQRRMMTQHSSGAWERLGPWDAWAEARFERGAVAADGTRLLGAARGLGVLRADAGEWQQVRRGNGGAVALDPHDAAVIYAAPTGLAVAKSRDGGATFAAAHNGIEDTGLFIAPLVLDPADSGRLWTGGRALWRTDDGAEHWTQASRTLGDTATARVSAIAVAPGDGKRVLAGTSEGEIYAHYEAPTAGADDPWLGVRLRAGFVSALVYAADGQTVYATYSTVGGAHVWRSDDDGARWYATAARGLPDVPVHCLVVDPTMSERLWIGTDLGVFVSLDGGESWLVEQAGFDETPVEALAANATADGLQLFAFTAGRGVWRVAVPQQQCTYTLAPTSGRFEAMGGMGSVAVTAVGSNCNWTATTTTTWITINSGTPGSGNGTVAYTVAANTTAAARTGSMTIAGITFNVFQAGTGGSCNATPITPGQLVNGNLTDADCTSRRSTPGDRYSFSGRMGELVVVEMGGFDSFLVLIGPNDVTIATDDDGGSGGFNSRIPTGSGFFALPATGTYIIEAAAFSGGRGNYQLLLTQVPPGCGSYSIAPTSQSFEAGGGMGGLNIATGNDCPWTATSNIPWVTINAGGAAGNGSRSIGFTVAANTTTTFRTGTLIVAGQTFTVQQAGIGGSCAVTPIVAGQTVNGNLSVADCRGRFGTSGYLDRYSFTATAGEQVALTPTASFTPFVSLSAPNGAVVLEGTTRLPVSGFVTLPTTGTYLIEFTSSLSGTSGDYMLNLLSTPGGCGFALERTQQGFEFGGGTGGVNVMAGSGCAWSVNNPVTWITVTAGLSAVGDGAVAYTVAANNSVNARSAVLSIAGQSFLVEQAGVGGTCQVAPLTAGRTVSGNLSAADCRSRFRTSFVERYSFTATAGTQALLTAISTAFNPVLYLLGPDGATLAVNAARVPAGLGFLSLPTSGTYTVEVTSESTLSSGDYALTLTLADAGCGYGIAPTEQSFEFGGGTGSINVTTASGCAWTANSNAAWLTVGPGGTGNGAVNFAAAANNSTTFRTATITVAGQVFTVEQAGVGGNCTVAALAEGRVVTGTLANADCRSRVDRSSTYYADRYSFSGTAGRQVAVLVPSAGFTPRLFLLAPDGSVVATGNTRLPASGMVTLPVSGTYLLEVTSQTSSTSGEYTLALVGAPAGCNYLLTPTRRALEAVGGMGEIAVTAGAGCNWTATSNAFWLTVGTGASGTGNGTVGYTVAANTSSSYRTGTLTVAGRLFTVEQAGVGGGCGTTPLTVGQAASGTLSVADCRAAFDVRFYADRYTLNATAGEQLAFTVTSASFTPQLTLFGPNGATLLSGTGTRFPSGTSFFTLPVTGAYLVEFTSSFSESTGGYTLTASAPPTASCNYAVLPPNQEFEFAGGSGMINVLTGNTCAWTAMVAANTPWLTISAGTSGTGNGTVNFTVAANPNNGFRSGTITVSGQTFTVRQAGTGGACGAVALTPGQPVNGTLSDGDCRSQFRTSSTFYADRYTFDATAGEQATVQILSAATMLFFTLSGSNGVVASDIGGGFIGLPATGAYTLEVTSASSFSSGAYSFNLLVTPGGCGYTIAPMGRTFEFAGGTGSLDVTAAGTCPWTATPGVNWITITAGATGSGNGTVNFTVATNATSNLRRGNLLLGGQVFTVEQAGVGGNCTVTPLTPGTVVSGNLSDADCRSRFRTGGTFYAERYTFSATAGQTAALILPSSTFTPVLYLAAPDGSLLASSGARLPAGNDLFTLPQTGTYLVEVTNSSSSSTGDFSLTLMLGSAGCSYTIAPLRQSFEFAGGTGGVNVATLSSCSWTASSNAAWLTLAAGASGTGNGAVSFAVTTNTSSTPRRATLNVAGQAFTVEQAGVGGTCTATPIAAGQTVGGNLSSSDCLAQFRTGGTFYARRYTFASLAGRQLTLLPQATAFTPYLYLVAPGGAVLNEGTGNRVLTLPVSGTYLVELTTNSSSGTGAFALALNLTPPACAYAVTMATQSFEFGGGTGTVNVTTLSGCPWTANANVPWLTITTGASGDGNGTVNFTIAANTTATARSGTLTVAGRTVTIEQAAAGGNCTVAAITPGQTVNGSLSAAECLSRFRPNGTFYADRFSFTGAAGDRVAVSLTAAPGSSFTPFLYLVGPAGGVLAQNNGGASANGGGLPPGAGFFVLPASGAYLLEATTASSSVTGGYTLTLTLQPSCSTIVPTNRTVGAEGGDGSVTVTAPAGCDWTAASNAGWLTINTGLSGTGNGTVGYTVAPHTGAQPRTGGLIIGGRLFTVTQMPSLAVVSAASFSGAEVTSESIAAAFGVNLATATLAATTLPLPVTLAGTSVRLRDSAGAERLVPLFFVSPGQINFLIPADTAAGLAFVTITNSNNQQAFGTVQIVPVAPALFAANADGQGVAAAVALRLRGEVQTFEPVAQLDAATGRFVAVPIDLGPEGDQVYLVVFGAGFRARSSPAAATVTVGGVNVPVLFAGAAPGFIGLDQLNAGPLPRSLAGRGEVEVRLTVDGRTANTVRVSIR